MIWLIQMVMRRNDSIKNKRLSCYYNKGRTSRASLRTGAAPFRHHHTFIIYERGCLFFGLGTEAAPCEPYYQQGIEYYAKRLQCGLGH